MIVMQMRVTKDSTLMSAIMMAIMRAMEMEIKALMAVALAMLVMRLVRLRRVACRGVGEPPRLG